jgi:hypothetical protein
LRLNYRYFRGIKTIYMYLISGKSEKCKLQRRFSLIIFILILQLSSLAQTGTIGLGSTGLASTHAWWPIMSLNYYSYSQQIYTAAELNASGLYGPGSIQSIGFYCATANVPTSSFDQITVLMGNTALSTFENTTSWIPASGLNNVGTWVLPPTTYVGWINFTLTTPFFWDGISNIVVAMDENANYGSSQFVQWGSFTSTPVLGNQKLSLSYSNNGNNPDPNSPPAANQSSNNGRSQVQFSLVAPSTCADVTNIFVSNSVTAYGSLNCKDQTLLTNPNFSSYQWKRDNEVILGAESPSFNIPTSAVPEIHSYKCEAFCAVSGQTLVSNEINVQSQNCFADFSSSINYMLIQNVTTGVVNASNETAQIQFDLNWGYSWRDSINWDAAWIFMKYKNAVGEWKSCKLKTSGYDLGQGTPINIQVSADQMGAFVSLAQQGNAHIDVQGMQLQWDYSGENIPNAGVVEVKVFAIEMVYVPQGDFNLYKTFGGTTITAPGNNFVVINSRLTPIINYPGGTCRIKGDAGLDINADGSIDRPDYPTGHTPFYAFKYEMSEQQYADFLNCLTISQRATLGVAGTSITLNNGVYFASAPNRACNGFTDARALAYADWSGLRPMTILEYSKAALGPYQPYTGGYVYPLSNNTPLGGYFDSGAPANVGGQDVSISGDISNTISGSGYYGMKDMGGNVAEEVVNINFVNFSKNIHGNGNLSSSGNSDVANWSGLTMVYCEPYTSANPIGNLVTRGFGFRFARTAE